MSDVCLDTTARISAGGNTNFTLLGRSCAKSHRDCALCKVAELIFVIRTVCRCGCAFASGSSQGFFPMCIDTCLYVYVYNCMYVCVACQWKNCPKTYFHFCRMRDLHCRFKRMMPTILGSLLDGLHCIFFLCNKTTDIQKSGVGLQHVLVFIH